MNIIEVRGLAKEYPAFQLKDVSFALEQGHIAGFIGRNGAGKTTAIKSMLGFVHPDSGRILYFGKDFEGNERWVKQKLGYVAGGFGFYPHKKLRYITRVASSFYEQWDWKAYQGYCRMFGLSEDKTTAQLSEGMRVKYSILLALSYHASLLILDEPTSGLDPVSRDELLEIFRELKKRGVTILFSTHIISDLEKCADDIIYIQEGRIHSACSIREFEAAYPQGSLEEIMLGLEREAGKIKWEAGGL